MTHQSVANAEIVKIDDEKRLVFGWASIIKDEGGKILLDRQDDFIDSEDELESAAYDYVLKSRDGGEMHVRRGVAKMVESVVFTEEKQRALGIPVGSMPTGWWIGFKVNDDRVWQQVKKGEYAGFSVHGTGKRQSTELPLSKITEIGKADKKKKKNKIATVMGEFKRGKLKSSSGEKVTDPKQAMAIAISEQKRAKMKKISLSHIIGKAEELAKVGDKPGHPFRGNQHTSGKSRPRIGGGSAPAGGAKGAPPDKSKKPNVKRGSGTSTPKTLEEQSAKVKSDYDGLSHEQRGKYVEAVRTAGGLTTAMGYGGASLQYAQTVHALGMKATKAPKGPAPDKSKKPKRSGYGVAGGIPHGGTKASLERAKAKQLARAKKFKAKRGK